MEKLFIYCPKCGAAQEDFDGLGFMCCTECDYCIHPNSTEENGVNFCGFCGKLIHDPRSGESS